MNETIVILLVVLLLLVVLMIAMQVIFAIYGNEIKSFFSRLRFIHRNRNDDLTFVMTFINNLTSVLIKMSADKIGALIVIENKDNLSPYINIGNRIDSAFFPEFITSIFYNKKSPLHDGAVIIRNWRIASMSSYLPMTKKIVNVEYGARHRAAFGVCEKFDCFAFVVSETNGNITSVHLDDFQRLSSQPEKLAGEITKIFTSGGIFNELKSLRKVDVVSELDELSKVKPSKRK